MEQLAAWEAVDALVAEVLRDPSVPSSTPWLWTGGIHGSTQPDGSGRFGISILVDRDRCPQARAVAIARDLTARFAAAHPGHALQVHLEPVTRIDHTRRIVDDHFDLCASRDAADLQRDGTAWAYYAGAERIIGWTPAGDRIRVELHAESSADEASARAVGERWLAPLVEAHPWIAAVVDVVGTSH